MDRADATVCFVPREVFCQTRQSLETLYRRTHEPFSLVCVDGASPPDVAEYLQRAAVQRGFTLLGTDRFVTPNEARNLAARWAIENHDPRHLVFVDNDVVVSEGWLEALVRCADETGAWVVGPAYYEHLPERSRLHMFGGECRITTDAAGRRSYYEQHYLPHVPADEVAEPLERRRTDLIEFHTALVTREAYEAIGPLDEGLHCNAEHGDLCLEVRKAGREVWLEPAAKITYTPPRRLGAADREYFFLRWSEAWMRANRERMAQKWDLDPADYDAGGAGDAWVVSHRRLGLNTLSELRRVLGKKWTKSIEKRLVAPIERLANERRYPFERFAFQAPPRVTVVHDAARRHAAA